MISKRTENFKILNNTLGMLMEIGLIIALSAFCLFCFITGMELPVAKLGLFIEIVSVSILFYFTFQTDRGSGYIFSGELILYSIGSFYFKNEISQGLAVIINKITEKIMNYYNVTLPLFEEAENTEQYMSAFLAFIIVILVGITAYIVVNKSGRFFLCMIQFPIALGSLLVGFLPKCLYFLGFVAAVAFLLTMPKQKVPYMREKKAMQSMVVKTTILAFGTFVFFIGSLTVIMPQKTYRTIETAEYKNQLQEQIQKSFLGKIGGGGSDTSVGGLSHGQLGKTGRLQYTGKKCLEVNISGEIQLPLYLKSYVGERYENDHWEKFSEAQQDMKREVIRQMKNGEEQGAAWMELFADISDWFSEEAFDKYVEQDIDNEMYMDNSTYVKMLNDTYIPHVEGYGGYMDETADSSTFDSVDMSQMEDYESMSEGGEQLHEEYDNIHIKSYAEGYSYKSIQAILGQKPTTIQVKNIGLSSSEEFVPYGRLLSKDKEENDVKSYTGYPNLNLYVKGGIDGYGYASGNFIEGIWERCWQTQNFLDECMACIPPKDRKKMQESDITIEGLIDKVQEYGGRFYSGNVEGQQYEDEVLAEDVVIQKKNGYYIMSVSYGREYILYFKSELKLKDVETYMDKVWEYTDRDYELYVNNYKDAGRYTSKISKICRNFQTNSVYAAFTGSGNADMNLKYIGECINFVTKYLADNMEYSLEPGKMPENENFIDYYLFQQKRGYCSHFATIATNMFRILNVPARYVEGFIVKKEDLPAKGASQNIYLEDKSAHAWVEIYVEGYGWIPVEVTPGYDTGVEGTDFSQLLKKLDNMNENKDNDKEGITPTPIPTGNKEVQQTERNNKKSVILNEKTMKWIKTVSTILLVCGVAVLLIWLRYVYIWKKRIYRHSHKQENERVCSYYARMEELLKGIHVIEETDTLRELLNAYAQGEQIKSPKALQYIENTTGRKQWTEFLEIINTAAYSNHDVTGYQLETVRLLEEKMRKEIFHSMSKIKILYYQYICLL